MPDQRNGGSLAPRLTHIRPPPAAQPVTANVSVNPSLVLTAFGSQRYRRGRLQGHSLTKSVVKRVSQTLDEWRQIQNSFEIKWNFPSCYGALDGNHTSIKRPPGSCAVFYNYKGGYSITQLALVDADCKFIYVDVGTNGRANDGSVFRLSSLKTAIDNDSLNLPQDYIIVADDAFPMTTNLIKPFSRRNLSLEERIFNYRLSRARRVAENAFGVLAGRFRVFRKEIEVNLSTVDLIVQAACKIHNWLRAASPGTYLKWDRLIMKTQKQECCIQGYGAHLELSCHP
ncbi:uncharacterized protein LOC124606350 [Schistocerca americana]|uniref:uncharacterized protein LOC124606350 n=1 Tax=Schistocerca americana TaxID=7009 RepID=UPI001F4F7CF9|nr:uncharacterized protein LOC124606350 [Schistocerca americana]